MLRIENKENEKKEQIQWKKNYASGAGVSSSDPTTFFRVVNNPTKIAVRSITAPMPK